MKKHKLRSISKKEIRSKYDLQDSSWNFYHEREFIEKLLNQRFNFIIVIYSIFIAAAATVETPTMFIIVLGVGFVFTLLMFFNIYRAYVKFNIMVKILYKLPEHHPLPVVSKEIKAMGCRALFGTNLIVGVIIPLFCVLSLLAGFILALCNVLDPTKI